MKSLEEKTLCCNISTDTCDDKPKKDLLPIYSEPLDDGPCCGPPSEPAGSPHERPGYKLLSFVDGFLQTPNGPVPRVRTTLTKKDFVGAVKVRLGIGRMRYRIAPGLYGVGNPSSDSPVLVTANYKLTFDTLRKHLAGTDAWILVLETQGVNVWCAAGKGTFSSSELISRIRTSGLENVVSHRELILPQLGATGVSALLVQKEIGFKVVWGPVRAQDIAPFLAAGKKATAQMRRVVFPFIERLVLVPIELTELLKPSLWIIPALFLISGIGTELFSVDKTLSRGLILLSAYLSGIFAGAIATPLLLPWVPGRAFSMKGAEIGLLVGVCLFGFSGVASGYLESAAAVLLTLSFSSYLAMNFTGATPFTSPSGVEKEMRRAIPLQAISVLAAGVVWIGTGFMT